LARLDWLWPRCLRIERIADPRERQEAFWDFESALFGIRGISMKENPKGAWQRQHVELSANCRSPQDTHRTTVISASTSEFGFEGWNVEK
jgi:hypothetical protein